MTAWQARVREYRRKKERLQLAQEFRNKTLLWQAFSRWMHFQVGKLRHTSQLSGVTVYPYIRTVIG
jgi:hypothetical protein